MTETTIVPYRGSYLMPSLAHATVADAMHPGVMSCEREATLTEVARIMATYHLHSVVVMGGGSGQPAGQLVWGLITDLDLLRAGLGDGAQPTAGELATQPIPSVQTTVALRKAAELMLEHNASHLVAIDAQTQRPVGVLSTLDIVGVLAWGED
jgi:CBS domain-containing protein